MIPSVKKAKMDSLCPHREGGTGTPEPRTYSTNIQQARNRTRLEQAWRVSGGGKTELLGILEDLRLRLAVVNGQAREYSDDENIRRGVRRIHDLMKDMADRYRVSGC